MYCRVFLGWGSGEQESWSQGPAGLRGRQDADQGLCLDGAAGGGRPPRTLQ